MNRVNGATILVNPFVLYRMIILPSPFKPIIASIKWKVSNNEGIIVARYTPCYPYDSHSVYYCRYCRVREEMVNDGRVS